MEVLYENELNVVTASFNGCGDSGTIDSFSAVDIDGVSVNAAELASILLPNCAPKTDDRFGEWINGGWLPRNFNSRPLTLLEFIDLVFSEELEMAHGGWEINAGSSGTLSIAIPRNADGSLCKTTTNQNLHIDIAYNDDDGYDEDN